MPEKTSSSTQIFNSCFVDDIKDLCINKANEKSRLIMHTYNNEKKSLMLMHSPKILEVSQDISFYFDAIMENNNNDNIRFSLREIT